MNKCVCKYCGSEMKLISVDMKKLEAIFKCPECGAELHVFPLKDVWIKGEKPKEVIE